MPTLAAEEVPNRPAVVLLEMTLTREGTPEGVAVVQGDAAYWPAAIAAVQQWRFNPVLRPRRMQIAFNMSAAQREPATICQPRHIPPASCDGPPPPVSMPDRPPWPAGIKNHTVGRIEIVELVVDGTGTVTQANAVARVTQFTPLAPGNALHTRFYPVKELLSFSRTVAWDGTSGKHDWK
jgi:hypothetical protein